MIQLRTIHSIRYTMMMLNYIGTLNTTINNTSNKLLSPSTPLANVVVHSQLYSPHIGLKWLQRHLPKCLSERLMLANSNLLSTRRTPATINPHWLTIPNTMMHWFHRYVDTPAPVATSTKVDPLFEWVSSNPVVPSRLMTKSLINLPEIHQYGKWLYFCK